MPTGASGTSSATIRRPSPRRGSASPPCPCRTPTRWTGRAGRSSSSGPDLASGRDGKASRRYPAAMTWREFWNRDTPIYAGERHKLLHYRLLAKDVAALIPSPEAAVLDHGSGEALSADRVAARCRRLYLCDAAPFVRERLARSE